MKRGKKWRAMIEKVDRDKQYDLTEAVELTRAVSYTKFDSTVEASLKIGYKSYQNIRGVVQLPHGTGKQVRVLVFAREDKHAEAKEAGADFVGGLELVEKIQKEGWTDFDACVATPDMMRDVGKLGPILGRRGLMPRPKAGNVTNEIAGAVKNLKSGQVEYRPDKTGVIHMGIGKVSFSVEQITENITALWQAITRDKPADAKGDYIKNLHIAPTMGPGVRVNTRVLIR